VNVRLTYAKELAKAGFPLTAKYIHGIYKVAAELSLRYQMRQDLEDFIQLAVIEAIRLEPIFDASKGNSFLSFIRKPIKQVAQKLYGYSRSSSNKFNKVAKFMEAYLVEHSVYPTVPIISKSLGITEWDVKSIYFGRPVKISLEALAEDFSLEDENSESIDDTLEDLLFGIEELDKKILLGFYIEEFNVEQLASIYNLPKKTIISILDSTIKFLKGVHDVR